jgi:putative DNA primase/helicase
LRRCGLALRWARGWLYGRAAVHLILAGARVSFEMPVWAALSASQLKRWTPLEGCSEVTVFGNNDANFTGQAAANDLAHRLKAKGIEVTVRIANEPDTYWLAIRQEHLRGRALE